MKKQLALAVVGGVLLGAPALAGLAAPPVAAATLYQAARPGCPTGGNWKLRTQATVNGPYVRHGIGPSSGQITYVTRHQNSSVTPMYSEVKWAYRSAGYMRITTAGNIVPGSHGGANCWR
jgi:hypothetical protein